MTSSRRWYLLMGLLLVTGVLLVAIFADQITPVSPYYTDRRTTVLEGRPPFPPSDAHPLGTDEWGRDVWSRVAYGTRWSLLFAALIMVGRLALALPLGMAAAVGPRFFGWLLARFYVIGSAIPPLLIYVLLLSVPQFKYIGLWPSVMITVALTTFVEWPRVAVALKGRLEELSGEQFVEGAVAAGATPTHIFWVHLMPHFWPTLLQTISAEMSRALLTVAQLGIFGIWIGGGIQELSDAINPVPTNVAGVPEWGTMLASARYFIRSMPWIPLAPATAFVVGVVGFNLLAQGLEGVTFSFYRWREATTGRLSPRWRWVWAPLALGLLLWWNATAVRDHVQGVRDVAARQTEALSAGNLQAYMATLDPTDQEYRAELQRWAESLTGSGHQVAVARPSSAEISGRTVKATWTVSFGYAEQPPVTTTRTVQLVKRDGQWYEARAGMFRLRGFYVDIDSFYDPLDQSMESAWRRYDIRRVSTAVDRAYEAVDEYFPAGARPRAVIYGNQEAFRAAVDPAADANALGTHRFTGDAMRVSPAVMNAYDFWDADKHLAYDMLKALTRLRTTREHMDPVVAGLYERRAGTDPSGKYPLSFFKLETGPLRSLGELYAVSPDALPLQSQPAFFAEATVLVDFLESRGLKQEQMLGATSPAPLAAALGVKEEALAAEFDAYLKQRIAALSMLHRPEWRSEMPDALLVAIAERAQAGAFEAMVLDMRVKDGTATVHVMEWLRGRGSVTVQEWTLQDGRWHMAGGSLPGR